MIYRDRIDAGKQLAAWLADYADRDDVLVLALPRGGVPVAYEVAKPCARRSIFSWCESSECRAMKNWRWAQSRLAASAFSTMMSSII